LTLAQRIEERDEAAAKPNPDPLETQTLIAGVGRLDAGPEDRGEG